MILNGQVTVNGEVVTVLGTRVDPSHDVVAVDGRLLNRPEHRTLLLHKPPGFITTRSDTHARKTVMTLLPAIAGLHPVGRLDKDTTGLILLTNDGDLTFALTHPRHHVPKTYRARISGVPGPGALQRLRDGIQLDDGITAAADVRLRERDGNSCVIELTIYEGRNRQIRRMLTAIGHPVLALSRQRLGLLTLGDLPEGAWREVTPDEITALYAAAGG